MHPERNHRRRQHSAVNPEDHEQTLGERLAASRAHKDTVAMRTSTVPYAPSRAPEVAAKRSGKGRPREISSRRPVPVGRDRCLGIGDSSRARSVRHGFDPRFEEHCGELREDHIERNFAFVNGLREKERVALAAAARSNPADEETVAKLQQMDFEAKQKKSAAIRKEIVQKYKREEKEAVKMGKKPFFLKASKLRELEMEAKFKELKGTGGLKKYIEKRRKRLTSKDRKLLPSRQDGPRGAGPSGL